MSRRLVSLLAVLGMLAGIFAAGCGSSSSSLIAVTITTPASAQTIAQGQTVNVIATVSGITNNGVSQNVTWRLSGSGCTGSACGSLTNQTGTSVTYNAPASVPSNMTVLVTATSVANPSKSASVGISVAAIAVTILNKVTELAAGNFTIFNAYFNAGVQYDPTGSGLTWSLTVNGAACSPGCGTLSEPFPFGGTVTYTPPASVPAAPDNAPTLTATSVADPSKSDTDTFTIFDGASACGTGGNESVLNGQYAIMLQGWSGSGTGTPILFGASFGADGTGKITGGMDQINLFSQATGLGVIPFASSYSVGPDNRGCLTLTDQLETTYTLHFSLGGITGGVASKGDIILFNEQSATPMRGSGILRRQDPTAFSLSALAQHYAIGVDGWDGTNGTLTHFALAGTFAQSGGNISNPMYDANDGGKLTGLDGPGMGSYGTIPAIYAGTGTAYASLNFPTPSGGFTNVVVYIINSSELFLISMDIGVNGAVASGRAIAAPSSYSATSVLPNYIFRLTGSSSGAAAASIGLASFSGGTSGTVSGSMDQYAGGAGSNQNLTGTYAFTENSGRLAVTGANSATSPICYLTNPVDSVSAFCISTDATASVGVFDTQPAATYSNSSLSGNFFFGSNGPGDNTVSDLSGVASISSGSLTGTVDTSAPTGTTLGSAFNATLFINADGSGNLGANTAAVTNGTVLYFIKEANGAPAEVQVFEQ